MNLTQVIQQRRSVRKFKDLPVPESMIRTMIDAAIYAPSASNRQPWRFIIVKDPTVRLSLAGCVQEAVDATTWDILSGYEDEYRSYSRSFSHFAQAPVLIIALVRAAPTLAVLLRSNTPSQERLSAMEVNGAIISVAMAVQNLLLSATDQGLGTCVMTGPLMAAESFARVLAVPEGWTILCMVCVGYSDESPLPIPKKTVEQVVINPK